MFRSPSQPVGRPPLLATVEKLRIYCTPLRPKSFVNMAVNIFGSHRWITSKILMNLVVRRSPPHLLEGCEYKSRVCRMTILNFCQQNDKTDAIIKSRS
jgi:hypothetical protein